MERRGFLKAILAAGIAPAVVKAGSLMRVEPIVVPSASSLDWWKGGNDVFFRNDQYLDGLITPRMYAREMLDVLRRNFIVSTVIPEDRIILTSGKSYVQIAGLK